MQVTFWLRNGRFAVKIWLRFALRGYDILTNRELSAKSRLIGLTSNDPLKRTIQALGHRAGRRTVRPTPHPAMER